MHMASWHTWASRRADDGRLADEHHLAGVAVIAVLDDRDIDVDDVAGLELPLPRDAVADLMIDRRADGFREAAVVERRRNRLLLVDDVVVADPIELTGGDARLHVGTDHVQHLRGQAPGYAHLLDLVVCLDGNAHGRCPVSGRAEFSLLIPILTAFV